MDYIVKLQKTEEITIFIDLNIIKEDINLLVTMHSKPYTRDVTFHWGLIGPLSTENNNSPLSVARK